MNLRRYKFKTLNKGGSTMKKLLFMLLVLGFLGSFAYAGEARSPRDSNRVNPMQLELERHRQQGRENQRQWDLQRERNFQREQEWQWQLQEQDRQRRE